MALDLGARNGAAHTDGRDLRVDGTYRLILERFEDHPQLRTLKFVSNVETFDIPLFYDVDSSPAKAPERSGEAGQFSVSSGRYLGQTPPGTTPELFAPGVVSTCHEHSSAMFTPDGTEIWFGRMFPDAIFFMKLENGRWTRPRTAPFCDEHGEYYPQLSSDGKKLYFTSSRPPKEGGAALRRGQGQLWVVERTGGGCWTEPRHLGTRINFGRRHGGGSLSKGGTLYYNVRVDGPSGRSTDIYRSVLTDGHYSPPERVEALRSDSPDHSPFIAPDESFIVFSSFRGGFGLSDLFISFRRDDGSWSRPRNMGSRINSPAKDEYPYVTPDGKYLFFNSNRVSSLNEFRIPEGPGNIYWVDARIIDELRPD
jgi:hypothetical protein